MVDTWTPLFLPDAESEDGEWAACAIHLADGKILQITNGLTPVFEWDDLLVINNTDGSIFASARLFTEVCVISGNGLAEGAYYGRMARVGADGFLYLYTENEAYDSRTISKINLSTMQEVGVFTSAHGEMELQDYPFMEVFEAGGVNYFALIYETYSTDTYIEVVNADTMVTAAFRTYTGIDKFYGTAVGGEPDVNTRNIYVNVLVGGFDTHFVLGRITYSAGGGLSDVIEVADYLSTDIRLGWVTGLAVSQLVYDPVDGNVITVCVNSSEEGGAITLLCKLSGNSHEVIWRVNIDDYTFGFDDFNAAPFAILGANRRLFFPLQDGFGRHYFIDAETGYWKEKIQSTHLAFAGFDVRPTWNFDTGIYLYLDDLSVTEEINPGDPAWFGGFAAYVPEWETPTQPPTGLGFDNDISVRISNFLTPLAPPTTEPFELIPGTCGDKQNVLLVISGHRNLAPDTESAHARVGFGFADADSVIGPGGYGTIQASSWRSGSGAASTYNLRGNTDNTGPIIYDATTTNKDMNSAFLQTGSNQGGFTIRYLAGDQEYDGFVVGFADNGAIDFEDAGYFQSGIIINSSEVYTFNVTRADFMIVIGSQNAAGTPEDHRFMFGFVDRNTGDQWCYSQVESDNVGAGRPAAIIRNDCVVVQQSRTGVGTDWTGVVTFPTDIQNTYTGSAGSPAKEGGLAPTIANHISIQLPNNTSYKIFSFTTPTVEGEVAYTQPGFTPSFLMMFGCSLEAFNTSVWNDAKAGGWQISVVTKYNAETSGETKQYAIGFRIMNDADPTDTASAFSEHALAIPSDSDCYEVVADLVSMDENGFTLNYTSVAAAGKIVLCLAIETGNINTCESEPAEAPDPEPGEALIGGSGMQMDALGCALTAQIFALETRDLNSILELGPFRFVEQKESDETSMITTLILGLTEADTGIVVTIDMATEADQTIDMDTLVDVLGDDIYIDMGEGVGNSDDFTLELLGNDDGSTYPGPPIEFKPEELTPIEDRGSTKQYSPTGYSFIYHRVRLKALEVDEKFAVKFVDISGQLTGRLF